MFLNYLSAQNEKYIPIPCVPSKNVDVINLVLSLM